eukprot:Sspe_Gene.19686::Locus_7186_Transcript_1_2_Confidence_0.667_Length_2601::g.19686::m.19686
MGDSGWGGHGIVVSTVVAVLVAAVLLVLAFWKHLTSNGLRRLAGLHLLPTDSDSEWQPQLHTILRNEGEALGLVMDGVKVVRVSGAARAAGILPGATVVQIGSTAVHDEQSVAMSLSACQHWVEILAIPPAPEPPTPPEVQRYHMLLQHFLKYR